MQKKNTRKILVAILVVIAITTFIVGAIHEQDQMKSETHLSTVLKNFLARDFIWDESRQKVGYPEYIEVIPSDDGSFYIIMPLETNYYFFYDTKDEPSFFVETPYSIKDAVHSEYRDLFEVCKKLSNNTCFLKTSFDGTVTIEKLRIYRGGVTEALDSTGVWYKQTSCSNFILA